jgi:hypothetical protein
VAPKKSALLLLALFYDILMQFSALHMHMHTRLLSRRETRVKVHFALCKARGVERGLIFRCRVSLCSSAQQRTYLISRAPCAGEKGQASRQLRRKIIARAHHTRRVSPARKITTKTSFSHLFAN